MIGLELGVPRSIKMRVNWEIIQAASPGLFAQLIVMPLMEEHHIIAMVSGENDVIKLLPPLNITPDEIDYFINALDQD
jgi:4-aminobutyrate aminotransferase-like enzyme